MSVTKCHLEDNKVLDNSPCVSLYNFITFYTVNVVCFHPASSHQFSVSQ